MCACFRRPKLSEPARGLLPPSKSTEEEERERADRQERLIVGIADGHTRAYGGARHFRVGGVAELAVTCLNAKEEPLRPRQRDFHALRCHRSGPTRSRLRGNCQAMGRLDYLSTRRVKYAG